jgi:hypothetical protein
MKVKAARLWTNGECIAVGCIKPKSPKSRGYCDEHGQELAFELGRGAKLLRSLKGDRS